MGGLQCLTGLPHPTSPHRPRFSMKNIPMPRFPTLFACLAFCLAPCFANADAPAVVPSTAPATDQARTVTVFAEGTMQIPSEFKSVPPQSRILDHEFQASEGEGDDVQTARVTMMASGGGVGPNIKRWQGQFAGGDPQAKKTEVIKVGQWTIHLVDNHGSFAERMGGGPFSGGKVIKRENWGMTGAILEHPQGRLYFVKMIGPHSVVKSNRDAFVKMIQSMDDD